MNLSKSNLSQISNNNIIKPADNVFNLPEKVLQFGTGVLLRGLPDYFIDKANPLLYLQLSLVCIAVDNLLCSKA